MKPNEAQNYLSILKILFFLLEFRFLIKKRRSLTAGNTKKVVKLDLKKGTKNYGQIRQANDNKWIAK